MKKRTFLFIIFATLICTFAFGQDKARERVYINIKLLELIQEEMIGTNSYHIDNNLPSLLKLGSKLSLSYVGTTKDIVRLSNYPDALTAKTVPTNTCIMSLIPVDENNSIKIVTLSSYDTDEMLYLLDELDNSSEYKYVSSDTSQDSIIHVFSHMHGRFLVSVEIESYRSGFWIAAIMAIRT